MPEEILTMTNHKTVSLRMEVKSLVGHDGYCALNESGKPCDCDIQQTTDQIISAVLERIPEKTIVPILASGNLSEYHEGFNEAIDETIKNITGDKDEM